MVVHIRDIDVFSLVVEGEHKKDYDTNYNAVWEVVFVWRIESNDHIDMVSDRYELTCDFQDDVQI